MSSKLSRRGLMAAAAAAIPVGILNFPSKLRADEPKKEAGISIPDNFPSHPPELVREMVLVSHFNLKRVTEIVDARPAMARAAWDWGFGDWETALGAASHMGNRAIAEYLISKGARPTLFSATMLGQIDVVKGFLAAEPGAQRIQGPHSISLLAHARVGDDAARPVLEYLQSLDGADQSAPAPLSSEETSALVGTYVFGSAPSQQVEVDADLKMYANSKMYGHSPQLNWKRAGTMPRPLFHIGNHTFYPAGAPSARICFNSNENGVVMTVNDPDLVLTAVRRKA